MSAEIQTILHVDMDAFFAAVEQHDNPALRGRPVIVGSPPDQRGVVSTASYEARRFGVHSAMPSRTAFKLCPHGVFLPVRGERYRDVSRSVMAVFRSVTPIVEPVSIDEAFMDVSGVLPQVGTAVDAARIIKDRIREETGLTASVGVAVNKFLAKVASDLNKPDGLTVVPVGDAAIRDFLAPLGVRKIWGIGERSAERLAKVGIRRIADIQERDLHTLVRLLGKSMGPHIWQLAHGIDERTVQHEPPEEKSISNETTFTVDCTDIRVVRQTLIELTEKVGRRLRAADKTATVATIKVRFEDFRTITRQQPLAKPTNSDRDLLHCARELLARADIGKRPIRLVGFGVTGLRGPEGLEDPRQPLLLAQKPEPRERRNRALDAVVDQLRNRYGVGILKRAWWPEDDDEENEQAPEA